ncbi:MAG: hypothetical protein ACLFQV_09540, partial [Vulcanimicrobiota bacterium]
MSIYKYLGLTKMANLEDVSMAYYKEFIRYTKENNFYKLELIRFAYDFLSDPIAKKAYDLIPIDFANQDVIGILREAETVLFQGNIPEAETLLKQILN